MYRQLISKLFLFGMTFISTIIFSLNRLPAQSLPFDRNYYLL